MYFYTQLGHVGTIFTYSASSHTRVMGVTTDTSSALHITLNGICNVVQTLLREGLKYVLTDHLQSDRIEAEFGIYRQQSGGNYNISVQQVVNVILSTDTVFITTLLPRIKVHALINENSLFGAFLSSQFPPGISACTYKMFLMKNNIK